MHAIVITAPGGPDVLTWTEVEDPVPGPGEVVVDVVAAGVNRADVMQRMGFYPPPPGAPPYPGLECSGTISLTGPGVTRWHAGDEVCALLAGGGYAERVVVPEGQLLPKPSGVPLGTAAAYPESACTVYSNVFQAAGLRRGEVLLVHGGGGGIGTMAIQLAKNAGATVAVTAGSREKLERCRELGADILIDYRDEDFTERLKNATGGHGADVILDIVGAAYLSANVSALAADGRLVSIGLLRGSKAELDMGTLMAKRGTIIGTTLRARPLEQKARIVEAVTEHVWPQIEAGRVNPVIYRELPFSAAAEAHRILESSAHTGKILLRAQ
jgi:putative PIG3 family NAD(P)H quinone oxidoreductase